MLADASWVLGELIGDAYSLETRMSKIGSPDFDPLKALEDGRFYEETFEDQAACVAAFEGLGARAQADGYLLTDILDRMQDVIALTASPKPAWHSALDCYLLDVLARRPNATPPVDEQARNEPLCLYLEALHRSRHTPDDAEANLRIALTAQAELQSRKASNAPMYLWSLDGHDFEARIQTLLFQIYGRLKQSGPMFAAIREAVVLSPNTYRLEMLAWMQCYHFPQFREDAFEAAFNYDDSYDDVRKHEDFAAYAKRRKKEVKSGKPLLRWHKMHDPSPATEIAAAEAATGTKLPEDYKAFLAERGRCKLSLHLETDSKELAFAGAADIAIWKGVFDHWLETMSAARDNLTDEWPAKYSAEARTLHSIATPWDNSSCLVMDLAPGAGHGRCFLWDHDEAYDLVPVGDTFTAALAAIEAGFMRDTPPIRLFFGFMPPE